MIETDLRWKHTSAAEWSFFVLSYASKSGRAPLSPARIDVLRKPWYVRVGVRERARAARRVPFHRRSSHNRALGPSNPFPLYYYTNQHRFCRVATKRNSTVNSYSPGWKILSPRSCTRAGKSSHFFFDGNLIDTFDVCCFYGLSNWDLFFLLSSPSSSSSFSSWSAKSSDWDKSNADKGYVDEIFRWGTSEVVIIEYENG